jgi:integrative and conjugative element protein (TIGR02256 family)
MIAGNEPNHAPLGARLLLRSQARDALRAAARGSRTRERGGILVGYRQRRDVVVDDALTVPDPRANRTTYVRRPGPAKHVLDTYLRHADACAGYIGEWHTHPQPEPPSHTDHAAMRTMTTRNRHPIAMVVAALQPDGTVQFHALLSTPDNWPHRLGGNHVPVPVAHP